MGQKTENILDYKGSMVFLIEGFLDQTTQDLLKNEVYESKPEQGELFLYGKKVKQPRLVKWFCNNVNYKYSYSYMTLIPEKMPEVIFKLSQDLSVLLSEYFPCCLVNLYRNGKDYVSYHSDDEDELGDEPTIASISIGATRKFMLKNKENKREFGIDLSPGSLLIMSGKTQKDWFHSIKKEPRAQEPRINLTFRPYHEKVFYVGQT